MFHIEQLLFRLKIVGVFLGQLGAQPPDAAVKVLFHQRLKGGKVAPLNGIQQAPVICDHFRKPAAGDGVQHPEAAVVGVGVLQGAPQIHLVHGGKPCPVQGAVGLVQPVVIGLFRGGKGRIGLHPSADERPLFLSWDL